MEKKKNKQQSLEDSLSEAINPKPKIDRLNAAASLLGDYRAESKSVPSPPNVDSIPSAVRAVSSPSAVSLPSAGRQQPISPERDFTKVANSIVRQIPKGAFIGKSKQMYDYLYSLTRGAIKPTRIVRVSKSNLMRGSGIKSTHTFYNNVRHLEEIGLINLTRIDGEKSGNQYEVILPEEITKPECIAHIAHLAQVEQLAQLAQKLLVAPSAVSALTALGSESMNTGVSEAPKTSFKDIKNDDEAFADFLANFSEVSRELTGKGLKKSDRENWKKLSELLILELRIAARRTNSISSIPAFLTEVLRRKLRDIPTVSKSSKPKADTVGQSEANSYEIRALDEAGREAALAELREFAEDDFLEDFKKWYTPEDWSWLIAEMKKAKKNEK